MGFYVSLEHRNRKRPTHAPWDLSELALRLFKRQSRSALGASMWRCAKIVSADSAMTRLRSQSPVFDVPNRRQHGRKDDHLPERHRQKTPSVRSAGRVLQLPILK